MNEPKFNSEIKVTSYITEEDTVIQATEIYRDGILRQVMRDIYDLKDKQLREILIAQGWTPPKTAEGQSHE